MSDFIRRKPPDAFFPHLRILSIPLIPTSDIKFLMNQ